MSATRACQPCRTAKIRCDLQKPACGACRRRNVECTGLPEHSYIFRDQNESARSASARARRGQPLSAQQPVELATTASSETVSNHDAEEISLTSRAMPWLKQPAPTSIFFSLEDRARQIFYSEWILHPSNYGVSPGYLDIVPMLEAQASDNAVLSLAVDAFAMANIQNFIVSGGNLKALASRKYGMALVALRRAVAEGQRATSDHLLLAILIIDLFEIFFTNREEQLGAHSGAVEHMLTARRLQNVASSGGFSVYRIAHHRLQSRQLLLGLDPLPVQLACIDMLNDKDPSVKLVKMFLKELPVIRRVQEIVSSNTDNWIYAQDELPALMQRIRTMLDELDAWPQGIPRTWQSRFLQVVEHEQLQQFLRDASLPAIRQIRLYHDPWIAYQLNFFYQGQIAIRSALIDLLNWAKSNVTAVTQRSNQLSEWIEEQKGMISGFADALVESTPPLIGSTDLRAFEPEFCHGKKIGRWFAREACWTLKNAKHVPLPHRDFAEKAIVWMQNLESQNLS